MSRAEKWAVTGSNPLTAMTRLLPLVSQLRCPGLSDKRGLTEIVAWPLRDTAALAAEDKPGGELALPAVENRKRAATDRIAAAEGRARAAADRAQAALDREDAARDRAEAEAERAALLED